MCRLFRFVLKSLRQLIADPVLVVHGHLRKE